MSFQGLTPEALVARTDSKNPATTCKGLTTNGRPCRRSLGSTPASSPAPSPGTSPLKDGDYSGVVAILNEGDAAAFFCWQHKAQAESLVTSLRQQQRQTTRIVPLHKRSSIDTLAEKVGILNLDEQSDVSSQIVDRGQRDRHRVKKRDTLPPEWQRIEGPLMSVPEDVMEETMANPSRSPRRRPSPRAENHGRSNVKASWSCCIRADDDYRDDDPPPRRRERNDQRRTSHQGRSQAGQRPSHSTTSVKIVHGQPQMQERPRPQSQSHRYSDPNASRRRSYQVPPEQQSTSIRPMPSSSNTSPHLQTQNFLSFIPPHLNPSTTSVLLAELSKPFAKDDEAGYIYVFWLTPTSEPAIPDDDVASTILDGDLDYQDDPKITPTSRRVSRQHEPLPDSTAKKRARALDRYASVKRDQTRKEPPRILLKIGRAQNVHRRMTQWTKQCNQNITLVRYYPYHSSTAADPRSPGGSKVPHVNRVERLIHLELRGMGMGKDKESCAECGREHREWFEVPGTQEGLRGVDGVVKRWVKWAEGLPEDNNHGRATAGKSNVTGYY